MENNSIVPVKKSDNAIVSISKQIALTNKLLNSKKVDGVILYDFLRYNNDKKIENNLIKYIWKNLWYYLNPIIYFVTNKSLANQSIDEKLSKLLCKYDLNYEYPRSYYRKRGNGVTIVNKEYDEDLKVKNEIYIWCSPPIESDFNAMILNNINHRIAGAILVNLADTSIGVIMKIKINYL